MVLQTYLVTDVIIELRGDEPPRGPVANAVLLPLAPFGVYRAKCKAGTTGGWATWKRGVSGSRTKS